MNTYTKTILTIGMTILVVQACHATTEFDKLKDQMNTTFKALFDPVPEKFVLIKFGKDPQAKIKLNNFHKAILDTAMFVKNNNKGLILGASSTLTQANETLVLETNNLVNNLSDIKERLTKTNTLAGDAWDSVTKAQQDATILANIQDKIKQKKDILRPKVDDYKSTAQKESYALLMDALQNIFDAAAIVRNQLYVGGWTKKQ